jgi:hypothetical protein
MDSTYKINFTMNFKEAKELKSRIGEKLTYNGAELKVFVSPTQAGRFGEYLAEFRNNEDTFSDETSKFYAVNNNYMCCGLGYRFDELVYKILLSENDVS